MVFWGPGNTSAYSHRCWEQWVFSNPASVGGSKLRRYNHRISERKWLKEWGDDSSPKSCPYYGAALIPASAEGIGLDNARVLILADTYRRFDQEKAGPLALGIVPPSFTLTSEIERSARELGCLVTELGDRKSTRLNSSHVRISYAVFCLKKKI